MMKSFLCLAIEIKNPATIAITPNQTRFIKGFIETSTVNTSFF